MKLWSLYNEEEKLRIDDLNAEQVKIIMLGISSRCMRHWYACPQGKMKWTPLADVHEFQEQAAEMQAQLLPLKRAAGAENLSETPPRGPTGTAAPKLLADSDEKEFDNNDNRSSPTLTMADLSLTKERRTARRYARQWNFRCTIGEQVFKCETVDVSMSGLSLANDLPKWIPRVFKAELMLGGASSEILCEKVSARKIKISSADNWDLLRRWIVNF